MPPAKRLVIVAGEESGDAHAASIIRKLVSKNPDLQVSGIGGRHMEQAGAKLICNLAQFGVTGLTEVLQHIKIIKHAFNEIKAHLKSNKPDLLVLVDYPGFNLRLAKYAKKELGIKIVYYISPQIWAWKAGRIKTIQAYIDHMAVIFPFEKTLYEGFNVPVSFVGHPLVKKVHAQRANDDSLNKFNLPKNKRLIAVLPGSRTHEIEQHMPVIAKAAQKLYKKDKQIHMVIPVAGTIKPNLITRYFQGLSVPYTLTFEHPIETADCCECIVVASGTASLECALLQKPMCIIYKASLLTYLAASKLIKVKYIGLCNLLANQMIVPELLQYDCNDKELTHTMTMLLYDKTEQQKLINHLSKLHDLLSVQQADSTISTLIEHELE